MRATPACMTDESAASASLPKTSEPSKEVEANNMFLSAVYREAYGVRRIPALWLLVVVSG